VTVLARRPLMLARFVRYPLSRSEAQSPSAKARAPTLGCHTW
jgi:hypothetical protein